MITLEQHLDNNDAQIRREAVRYAKSYNCTLTQALRDVSDEYRQGWYEARDAQRHGDWDYGRE